MSTDTVRLSFPARQVARIEFARPDRANSLRPLDLEALHRCLDLAEERSDVHVLAITGAGRHFSAGFDLGSMLERARGEMAADELQADFERVVNRIEGTRLITLAALNGPAVGGATDLALACDLRIGSEHASMTMPAARFGLPLNASALRRYTTRLGLTQAKWLVLTASALDAKAMLAAGFVSEIVAVDRFEDRVDSLLAHLAAMPGGALSAMKQVLNATATQWSDEAAQRAHRMLVDAVDPGVIANGIADALAQRRS